MVVGLVNLGKFQLVANGWFAFIHKIKYRHVFTYMHRYIYIYIDIPTNQQNLPSNQKQKKRLKLENQPIKNLTKTKVHLQWLNQRPSWCLMHRQSACKEKTDLRPAVGRSAMGEIFTFDVRITGFLTLGTGSGGKNLKLGGKPPV